MKLQTGTVRTNCMDNLDRTNVAQAAFAKWTLNQQLQTLGILNEGESIDNYEELLKDFRESECLPPSTSPVNFCCAGTRLLMV